MKDFPEKVQNKYRIIKGILKKYPTFNFCVDQLVGLKDIDYKMVLTFHEHPHFIGDEPIIHHIKYEHLIYRGFNTKSMMIETTLYMAVFQNLETEKIHLKPGYTKSERLENRYYHTSNLWKFVEYMRTRTGPRYEICATEKQLNTFTRKNNITAKNVLDFTFGGKTELLIPSLEIPQNLWDEMWRIFSGRNFDSL